jgi:hypothetical protein
VKLEIVNLRLLASLRGLVKLILEDYLAWKLLWLINSVKESCIQEGVFYFLVYKLACSWDNISIHIYIIVCRAQRGLYSRGRSCLSNKEPSCGEQSLL